MSDHQHHDCHDLLSRICDYIDGELESFACAELEKHLADCDNCRIMVDTTRKTVRLYQQYEPRTLPPQVSQRLQTALEQAGCFEQSSN